VSRKLVANWSYNSRFVSREGAKLWDKTSRERRDPHEPTARRVLFCDCYSGLFGSLRSLRVSSFFLSRSLSPSGHLRLFRSVPRDIPRFPLALSLSPCRVESVSVVTAAARRSPNKYCPFATRFAVLPPRESHQLRDSKRTSGIDKLYREGIAKSIV